MFGYNADMQLGFGHVTSLNQPWPLPISNREPVISVSLGDAHSAFIAGVCACVCVCVRVTAFHT